VIGPTSQCAVCARFRPSTQPDGKPFCAAFPGGIPDAVYGMLLDHRQPVNGDHGVRWLSLNDQPFPDWALQSTIASQLTPLSTSS
jgi:hypothetical protein